MRYDSLISVRLGRHAPSSCASFVFLHACWGHPIYPIACSQNIYIQEYHTLLVIKIDPSVTATTRRSSGARMASSVEAPGPSTGTGIAGSWGQIGATPLSLPDRSPGEGPMLTYWIKDTLYVAVTNRCNVRSSLIFSPFLPLARPPSLPTYLPLHLPLSRLLPGPSCIFS